MKGGQEEGWGSERRSVRGVRGMRGVRGHAGDKGKRCSAGTGVRDEARRWSGRGVKVGGV